MRRLLLGLAFVLLHAGSAHAQNCVTVNGASVCTASTTTPTMAVRQRGTGYAFCVQSATSGTNLWCIDKTGVSTSTVASIFGADAIATTSTDGLIVKNATLATAGVTVQMSPRIRLQGAAWNSTALSSETDSWFVENLPATVAGTTTSTLKFGSIINGGAATYPMTLGSNGSVVLSGTGNFTVPAAASFAFTGRGFYSTPSDGNHLLTNGAFTIGAMFKVDALPTVSACGAGSPAVTAGSTALYGSVTIGTTAVATCTITFNGTAYPSAPHCSGAVETTNAANVRAMGYSATTTVLTIVPASAWADSSVVNWQCGGSK